MNCVLCKANEPSLTGSALLGRLQVPDFHDPSTHTCYKARLHFKECHTFTDRMCAAIKNNFLVILKENREKLVLVL